MNSMLMFYRTATTLKAICTVVNVLVTTLNTAHLWYQSVHLVLSSESEIVQLECESSGDQIHFIPKPVMNSITAQFTQLD